MACLPVVILASFFLQLVNECSGVDDYEARVSRLEATVGQLIETLEEFDILPGIPAQTCQEILWRDRSATSGEYVLRTKSGKIIKAYCEMGLNGGGYTFLSARSISALDNDDIQSMFSDNTSILLRVRKTDGTQRYAVLSQLYQYSNYPIVIGKSTVPAGYGGLSNAHTSLLGSDFLYFSFLPGSPQRSVLGIKVNSVEVKYQHCGSIMSSHLTFFPNFKERLPSTSIGTSPFLQAVLANTRQTPSFRGLPEQFYMFTEIHFGGCGVSTDSILLLSQNAVSGMAMGFR